MHDFVTLIACDILDVSDMRKLAAMLEEGEEEVFRGKHILPAIYRDDPGGITYSRIVDPPDWVLDFWHPWEKVMNIRYPSPVLSVHCPLCAIMSN